MLLALEVPAWAWGRFLALCVDKRARHAGLVILSCREACKAWEALQLARGSTCYQERQL